MKKIEQINKKGKIVLAKDKPLKKKGIFDILSNFFDKINSISGGFQVFLNRKKYIILIKNITYLGHPHPIFKKRIQIPEKWNKIIKNENVLLLGIYHYKDNIIFTSFDKKIRGKSSSAHVHTIDIIKAIEYGVFRKTDKNGNNLIVFRQDKFQEVFKKIVKNKKVENVKEIKLFEDFSLGLNKDWEGISAYKEMIKSKFSQALQPEWTGFYLEYKFEMFLDKNNKYKKICKYVRNKKVDDFDFDLVFIKSRFLGDLKTHSLSSSAILGNDKIKFYKLLKKDGKVWYVVFNLEYKMDKNYNCIVCNFWNIQLNKLKKKNKKLDSYCNRMKKSGILLSMNILEFNQFNEKYISNFEQGKQPNGRSRNPKIKIYKKNIENFVIYRKTL